MHLKSIVDAMAAMISGIESDWHWFSLGIFPTVSEARICCQRFDNAAGVACLPATMPLHHIAQDSQRRFMNKCNLIMTGFKNRGSVCGKGPIHEDADERFPHQTSVYRLDTKTIRASSMMLLMLYISHQEAR